MFKVKIQPWNWDEILSELLIIAAPLKLRLMSELDREEEGELVLEELGWCCWAMRYFWGLAELVAAAAEAKRDFR